MKTTIRTEKSWDGKPYDVVDGENFSIRKDTYEKKRQLMLCSKNVKVGNGSRFDDIQKVDCSLQKGKLYWVNVGSYGFETWYVYVYDSETEGNLLCIFSEWDKDYGGKELGYPHDYFYANFLDKEQWGEYLGKKLIQDEDYKVEDTIFPSRHGWSEKKVCSTAALIKQENIIPPFVEIENHGEGWYAHIPSMPGLGESGETKEQAAKELMISLKVKLAYDLGIDVSVLD